MPQPVELVRGSNPMMPPDQKKIVHLATEDGWKPICGATYYSYDPFYGDRKEVTCPNCLRTMRGR